MARIWIRFYQELNDFLPRARRGGEFAHAVAGRTSVRDLIESLGVPHTEVDLILVNGASVSFDYLVCDGDRVSVYPTFESIDITPLLRLRPAPLREPRFVLDHHLGRLAAYLRLFGFDSLYGPDWDDTTLAEISAHQERILLTRDRGLLKRRAVRRGYCPREDHPRRQLVEVMRRFDLLSAAQPLTRCLACNGRLARVSADQVRGAVPPDVIASQSDLARCADCGRVYWRGTHYQRLRALIEAVRQELART
ncbi:MAG: Mut7-C RNAse domain-containing protein [Chloroflexota bacterium]